MSTPRAITGPLVALVLAVSVLVVHARVVLGDKTWDDVRYHTEIAPPRLAAADAIASGELPAWWEGSGLGVPLLGEPSHGAAYPLVWLAQGPLALDLVWIAHMFWLALGIALWSRRLGASELAAVLAGVLVAASGIIASAAIRGALPAVAHLPWIGWAALGIARASDDARARLRATVVLGVAIGALGLAGQLAIIVEAIALAIVVGWRRGTVRPLAIGIAAGVAIAALQWLPALFVIAGGAGADVGALKPSRLLELVVPGSFGAGNPDRAVAELAGTHPNWPSLYIGAPLVALATLARMSRRMIGLWVAFAIVVGLAGRGGWPGWLGAPELHLVVLAVIMAAHASLGVDALVAGERRAVRAIAGAAVASAIALGAVVAAVRANAESIALERALIDGGLGIACLIGILVLAWRGRGRLVIAVLLVAPSVGALGSTAPVIDRGVVEVRPAWADAAATAPNAGAPRRVFRPLSLFEDTSATSVPDAVSTLTGASAARFGIGAARSEDPARPPVHDRLWLAAAAAGGALLERYGITLAILPGSMVEGRNLPELARRTNWALVRYPASPAAAVVNEWIWISDEATAIKRLLPPGAGRGLPAGVVVLRGTGPEHQDEPSDPAPCTILRWTAGAIDLTCTASGTAHAVVSSTSAAGWTVHVAGEDTSWLTADVMRRAVVLPAGTHLVSWRYAAPGLVLGLLLAVVGLLALAGYALVIRRYKRDQASRETN